MSREITIRLPDWTDGMAEWDRAIVSDEERMALAIRLARENVERGTGGPFGAAVFERPSGRVVALGVNLVVPAANSVLHAEVVAIMLAERAVGSYSLAKSDAAAYELATSCDPCAMCLGAVLWSGVSRLVAGAAREDARALGFEEGPVFDQSWRYLEERGIEVVRGVRREDARSVLEKYRAKGGELYNA